MRRFHPFSVRRLLLFLPGLLLLLPGTALAQFTVTLNSDDELTIAGDSTDNTIVVTTDSEGFILINGAFLLINNLSLNGDKLAALIVKGGGGNDRIDLRGINPANFPNLVLKFQIDGGAGNDTIDGSPSADAIDGGDNEDTIDGGDGDDFIEGGKGDDVIDGGDGIDTINGDALSDDAFERGNGNDTIIGGPGNDFIDGGGGNDTIVGDGLAGEGDDFIEGGLGDDTIFGGPGDNTMFQEDETSEGDNQNAPKSRPTNPLETAAETAAEQMLLGEAGNDTLFVAASTVAQRADGGEGGDVLVVDALGFAVTQADTMLFISQHESIVFLGVETLMIENPGANTSPTAQDDQAATDEDTPVEIDVLVNDTDADADTLAVRITVEPAHGTATVNAGKHATGTITYTPNEHFNGADSLSYLIDDGRGGTDSAAVSITVNPVNDAPSAPQIISPEDGAMLFVGGAAGEDSQPPETPFVVAWTEASDVEGDSIRYTWELTTADDFATVLSSQDVGATTQLETDLGTVATLLNQQGVALNASVTLFHRVLASDGQVSAASDGARLTLVRGTITALEDAEGPPTEFALRGTYPNPFNPVTTIRYDVPFTSRVTVEVYDVRGQRVARLIEAEQAAGRHQVDWRADHQASGVYFVRLVAEAHVGAQRPFMAVKKVVLVK